MDADVSTRIEALFSAATEAVTNLSRGLAELGVRPTYNWRAVAEEALRPTQYIQVNWGGAEMEIPVSDFHLWPDHVPMFLARHMRQRGASEQEAQEAARRLEKFLQEGQRRGT